MICQNLSRVIGRSGNPCSIRAKILASIVFIFAIVTLAFTTVWIPQNEALLRRIEREEIQQQLHILASSLTPYILQREYAAIYESLDNLSKTHANWTQIMLQRADGRMLYPLSAPDIQVDDHTIVADIDVEMRGETFGKLTVVVDFSSRIALLERQNLQLGMVGAGILIMSLSLLAYTIGVLVGRPVRQMSEAAGELAKGNYDAELPQSRGDEIGTLSQSFAKMRKQILANNTEIEEARQAAEHAAGTKARFLASMSHEIRTPLNGVIPVSELLLETDLNDSQRKHVETIRRSGSALLSIVNDILDISKIDAGAYVIRPSAFEPARLVEDVVDILKVRADAQSTRLVADIAPEARSRFVSDDDRVRQVLVNLVGNAVKFTQDGEVRVEAGIVDRQDQAPLLRVDVTDSGIGIPAEDLSRIFESFSQVEGGYARRFEGSGLGLFICKTIVEALGGQIGVESEVGKGSRFWFEIPVERATGDQRKSTEPSGLKERAAARKNGKVQKVLLVDDNEINRIVGKAMLDDLGLETALAETGEEAVAAVRDGDFDLVLMDVQLPGMNGLSATREIRGLAGKKGDIRVVALTGSVYADERDACLEAGMDGYLSKPLSKTIVKRFLEA